jgi:hypothetical protein
MIYICYMFCEGGVETCVLAVRDNEHDSEDDVGDNEVASLSLYVAEAGTAWGSQGKSNLGVVETEPDFRRAGNSRNAVPKIFQEMEFSCSFRAPKVANIISFVRRCLSAFKSVPCCM